MIIKYKNGDYPTTLQMYEENFDENIFKELHKEYIAKFNICKCSNRFKYEYNQNDKFYRNASSYLIIDPNSNIVLSFAFNEFHDLVWLCQIANIDNLEFKLPKKVAEAVAKDIEAFSDRIEIIKK